MELSVAFDSLMKNENCNEEDLFPMRYCWIYYYGLDGFGEVDFDVGSFEELEECWNDFCKVDCQSEQTNFIYSIEIDDYEAKEE